MKTTVFEVFKFVVAASLFLVELYIHAYVKELNVFILGAPWAIMGVDPDKLASMIRGKK
jgi:hypothetical protein